MTLEKLLTKQRKALKKRNYKKALRLLDAIEAEIDKANSWDWLLSNQPKSYKQLIRKLAYATKGLAPSGKSELQSLARVFQWCEDHSIELSLFDLPGHVANYCEAASYLNQLINAAPDEHEERKAIRDTTTEISSHNTRRQTRVMVRTPHNKGISTYG